MLIKFAGQISNSIVRKAFAFLEKCQTGGREGEGGTNFSKLISLEHLDGRDLSLTII